MNNFIENVSRADILAGTHSDAGLNSMLIQISDIISEHPTPIKAFKEIHQFNFEDIEENEEWACTDPQAAQPRTSGRRRAQRRRRASAGED